MKTAQALPSSSPPTSTTTALGSRPPTAGPHSYSWAILLALLIISLPVFPTCSPVLWLQLSFHTFWFKICSLSSGFLSLWRGSLPAVNFYYFGLATRQSLTHHCEDPQLGLAFPDLGVGGCLGGAAAGPAGFHRPWRLEASGRPSRHWEGGQRSGMSESRRSAEEKLWSQRKARAQTHFLGIKRALRQPFPRHPKTHPSPTCTTFVRSVKRPKVRHVWISFYWGGLQIAKDWETD